MTPLCQCKYIILIFYGVSLTIMFSLQKRKEIAIDLGAFSVRLHVQLLHPFIHIQFIAHDC